MALIHPISDRLRYSARTAIDAGFGGKKEYIKHLEDCIANPTIGLTARHKFMKGYTPSPELKRNPTVKYLEEILNERINAFYPKTKVLRQYIIDSGRMRMFHISKAKPFTFIDKAKIALKTLIH